jgi:hypothetical protein
LERAVVIGDVIIGSDFKGGRWRRLRIVFLKFNRRKRFERRRS